MDLTSLFPHSISRHDMHEAEEIMTCNDIGWELASKLVLEALFYKAEALYQQRAIAAKVGNSLSHHYVERAYKLKPVKALEFEAPHQQCVVYLDLKRDECAILFLEGKVYSQGFHLGGQELFLSAHCNMDQQGAHRCLGLFLGMQGEESEPLAVHYEFSVCMSPDNEFVSKHKGNHTLNSAMFDENGKVRFPNLCYTRNHGHLCYLQGQDESHLYSLSNM